MKAAILKTLVAQGLRSSQMGAGLSAQTFDKMLRSPIYAGWIDSTWGITLRGKFQPIINDDLLKQVQTRLSGGTVPATREVHRLHSEDFPLRVFIKCAGVVKALQVRLQRVEAVRSTLTTFAQARMPQCEVLP